MLGEEGKAFLLSRIPTNKHRRKDRATKITIFQPSKYSLIQARINSGCQNHWVKRWRTGCLHSLKVSATDYRLLTKGTMVPLQWRHLADTTFTKLSASTSPVRGQTDIWYLPMHGTEKTTPSYVVFLLESCSIRESNHEDTIRHVQQHREPYSLRMSVSLNVEDKG